MSLVYYSSYPYYPWPGELERQRRSVMVIILVVILVATVVGWTPPEILRLLALLHSGS